MLNHDKSSESFEYPFVPVPAAERYADDRALVHGLISCHEQRLADPSPLNHLHFDARLSRVCAIVDRVRLSGVRGHDLEDARSMVKFKISRNPACLREFRGSVSLLSYLRYAVERAYQSFGRKERRYRGGELGEHNRAAPHCKLYAIDGDGTGGGASLVSFIVASDLIEHRFERPDPTRAGRPTSLRGAINQRGLVGSLREYTDVVIACSQGRFPSLHGWSTEGVRQLALLANSDRSALFEVAYDGYEVLATVCDACIAQIDGLGSAIRASAREELAVIRQDLDAVGRRINAIVGGAQAAASTS